MVVKAKDVIGLKVVTLRRGREVDDVQDVIYNPKANRVVALLVDKGGWFSSAKVILMDSVKNIGKDAVIIESSDVLTKVEDIEKSVSKIAKSDSYLTNTKIITETGNELGKVSDIYFDDQTGEVVEFEVSEGGLKNIASGKKTIRFRDIVTIGQDATIVRAQTEENMKEQATEQGIQGTMETVKEKIPHIAEDIKTKAGEAAEKTKEVATQVKDKAQEKLEEGKEKVEEIKNDEKVQSTIADIKNKASEAEQRIREGINNTKQAIGKKAEEINRKAEQVGQDAKDNVQMAAEDMESTIEKGEDAMKEEQWDGVLGMFLTRTVTAPDNFIIGEKGEMITKEMLIEADSYGMSEEVVESSSKEPTIMEIGNDPTEKSYKEF